MKIKANAKINLALDVVGKKDNGYHELDMVMVPISLYDNLDIEISDQDSVICNNINLDDDNTIIKAIKELRSYCGFNEKFKVVLDKHIPMQAGLAGGSADAAATLKAINELLNLNLTLDELMKIGVKVGADVPFCLFNKPARVQGIGEIITPISLESRDVLLVKPKSGVSTVQAFKNLDLSSCVHPDMDRLICNINYGLDYTKLLDNSLENVSIMLNPEIQQVKDDLKEYHLDTVLMSGSGSSVFALGHISHLKKAKDELKNKYEFVEIVEIMN